MNEIAYTKKQIEDEEGRVPYVYQDSLGYDTIGVGFLVEKGMGGLDDEEIDWILDHRIAKRKAEMTAKYPWMLIKLDPVRFAAVFNMFYQLGAARFAGFVKMLAALQLMDWTTASHEAKDSAWYHQTPERAERMCKQILTGEWQWIGKK